MEPEARAAAETRLRVGRAGDGRRKTSARALTSGPLPIRTLPPQLVYALLARQPTTARRLGPVHYGCCPAARGSWSRIRRRASLQPRRERGSHSRRRHGPSTSKARSAFCFKLKLGSLSNKSALLFFAVRKRGQGPGAERTREQSRCQKKACQLPSEGNTPDIARNRT